MARHHTIYGTKKRTYFKGAGSPRRATKGGSPLPRSSRAAQRSLGTLGARNRAAAHARKRLP